MDKWMLEMIGKMSVMTRYMAYSVVEGYLKMILACSCDLESFVGEKHYISSLKYKTPPTTIQRVFFSNLFRIKHSYHLNARSVSGRVFL
jgi:hypothetical protein